jgi:DNA repair photolyase
MEVSTRAHGRMHGPERHGEIAVQVLTRMASSILTAQRSGFLAGGPYPFTHSLACYTGCAYGASSCGLYCYAASLPNWTFARPTPDTRWGAVVAIKENAPALLDAALRAMAPQRRAALRIFMSTSTDPYQPPLESRWRLTRQCLEVIARYDIDLLLIQTRSPLVLRDLALIAALPAAFLSVTVESDDPALYRRLRGGPSPTQRLDVVRQALAQGIRTQVAVSPCLPYTERFADTLAALNPTRVIVDTFVDGDGTQGQRTAQSPYAAIPGWRDTVHAHALAAALKARGLDVGWSAAGFCGIAPRDRRTHIPAPQSP